MEHPAQWRFADFHLDPANACLRHKERLVKLKPKTLNVLCYLLERAGRLVTKEELFAALWPETAVSDGVLTTSINELRAALSDNAKTPRFIETVHRRGYRFIAPLSIAPPVASRQDSVVSRKEAAVSGAQLLIANWQLTTPLVGRDAELTQLHRWLDRALAGERQLVFITGEPGIGKTGVVQAFLAQLGADIEVGRGQCIDQYGGGEAYLPILEALGRLGRGPSGAPVTALLRHYAPTWLLQLPALLTPAEHEQLRHHGMGGTRDRMLRELCEALEAITVISPLVLVLEDLHWSDLSTLEALAALARRREVARLLIVGTYRPVDGIVYAHPVNGVKQELQIHGLCRELALPYLSATAVAAYLGQRFAPQDFPPDLASLLFQRTEGNPLFMVNLVDTWVAQGALAQEDGAWKVVHPLLHIASAVSPSLLHFIEQRITRLEAVDQELLTVASVMGRQFSVTAVAAVMDRAASDVEEQCERLARLHLFLARVEEHGWPEQRHDPYYGFLHTLHQAAWYARLSPGRRTQFHRRFGEWIERRAGTQASARAAALAVHFEEGQEYGRAAQYRRQAGETALQRSALQEAIEHFTKGLTLLEALPHSSERVQQELLLCTLLGAALVMKNGYAATEVEQTYARAQAVCQQLGAQPQLVPALLGLWGFHLTRGELTAARELAHTLLRLAQDTRETTLLLGASRAYGITQYYLGALSLARAHLEQGIACYDPHQHRPRTFLYSVADPGVACLSYHALTLWMLGYPTQALDQIQKALALARELAHPFSHAFALNFAAILHQLRREGQVARDQVNALLTLAREQGFGQFLLVGAILHGWTLATHGHWREGIAQMRESLAKAHALGADIGRPYYLSLLAETSAAGGETEAGLQLLDEALTGAHRSYEYDAELYRLKGELTLARARGRKRAVSLVAEAEGYFERAITLAHRQQAKSLELRAALSLSRLWQRQGKRQDASRLLADLYRWFTEGFDSKDLQEAKVLLEELT